MDGKKRKKRKNIGTLPRNQTPHYYRQIASDRPDAGIAVFYHRGTLSQNEKKEKMKTKKKKKELA